MTQSNRILVTVVAAVAAAAAFYMLVLSPKRDEVAALDVKVKKAQVELQTAEGLIRDYSAAKEGYRTSYASVVRLGKAVPVDDDVRSLVVQLDGAAAAAKVDFQSINVGGPDGAAAAAASAAAASATGAGANAAAAGATALASLPPGATVGTAGFPVMPFTFTFDGSFFRLSDFFRRLERFVSVRNERVSVTGRLLTLDSLSLTPTEFPKITAQVGATSFLVSPMQGLTGGATPQGPAAATTPAATGTTPATPPAGTAAPTTATSTGAIR